MLPHLPPWGLKCVLFALIFTTQYSTALVSKGVLPRELQDCYNRYARFSLRDVVGQSVCWACEAPVIRRLRTSSRASTYSPSARAYIQSIMDRMGNNIHGNMGTICRRKEYRMLTDAERRRFHNAINALKQDTSVSPNKYDVLAEIHSGPVINSAHGGPNFLGWHRVYLLMFESELQRVDSRICIPYWDSSLENELSDPSLSHVFGPDFLGGGGRNGPVTDGPFSGWETPRFGPLTRNFNPNIDLFSETNINNILSQARTSQVTPPTGFPPNVIENHHNRVHNFIGGQMNNLQAAAHDPIFFLHHCFVDYVWEAFRNRQRALGIEPQLDYPIVPSLPLHAPNRQMGFNMSITNIQGYNDTLTETYVYEPSPTCSRQRPTCGSRYLYCGEQSSRCVPVTNALSQGSLTSRTRNYVEIQNTFCVDDDCDTREWVFVPVKVVSVRSPDVKKYGSYAFYNGSMWDGADLYQPSAYTETFRYINPGNPKKYEKCDDGNGIGQIFIQSNGLSYDGFYKESVIIDQRLGTSMAVGYVAVKDPKNGPVKALFRAFDSCGRICNTAYKTPGTKSYQPFSGVLDIEDVPGRPKQYSQNYGQAILNTWGYSSNKDCPTFLDDDIVLTFYCDYGEEVPWANKNGPAKIPDFPKSLTSVGLNECRIDNECIIGVPCDRAGNQKFCFGQKYKCKGSCNQYVVCSSRRFLKMICPYNWSFDIWTGQCTSQQLCTSNTKRTMPRQL